MPALAAPIFEIRPVEWSPPPAGHYDALLLTSANAPRHAGPALAAYRDLDCYCVGEATAAAARAAGLDRIRTGPSNGEAALAMAADDGKTSVLHLAGREHLALSRPGMRVERQIVYASEPLPLAAREELFGDAIALFHSPRAAAHFAALIDDAKVPRKSVRVLAISPAAAAAAGSGWRSVHVAPEPRDAALLALAAELCKTGPSTGPGSGE